jgi:hypothetical protein
MTQDTYALLALPVALTAGGICWLIHRLAQRIARDRRRRIGGLWFYVRDQAPYTAEGWTQEPEDGIEILKVEDHAKASGSPQPCPSAAPLTLAIPPARSSGSTETPMALPRTG